MRTAIIENPADCVTFCAGFSNRYSRKQRSLINGNIYNAAIIENRRILLVRKKQSWILPGGKPEQNESDLECLCREVGEELSGTQLNNIRYYREFEGITPHKGDVLKAKVYFADIVGKIFLPAAEITAYDWVGDKNYNLSDITSKIVDSLIKEGYLAPNK